VCHGPVLSATSFPDFVDVYRCSSCMLSLFVFLNKNDADDDDIAVSFSFLASSASPDTSGLTSNTKMRIPNTFNTTVRRMCGVVSICVDAEAR